MYLQISAIGFLGRFWILYLLLNASASMHTGSSSSSSRTGRLERQSRRCNMLTPPANGYSICTIYEGQRTCKGGCSSGYRFSDGTDEVELTCQDGDGQWSPRESFGDCTRQSIGCVEPKSPDNGYRHCTSSKGLTICTGSCYEDYEFSDGTDEVKLTCHERDGHWSPKGSYGNCSRAYKKCEKPENPENGYHYCLESNGQLTCEGFCFPGHEFENGKDKVSLTCQEGDGHWSPRESFGDCSSTESEYDY